MLESRNNYGALYHKKIEAMKRKIKNEDFRFEILFYNEKNVVRTNKF